MLAEMDLKVSPKEEIARRQETSGFWFRTLRDDICDAFEQLEREAAEIDFYKGRAGKFERTYWDRPEGGGGEISIMRGRLFEKVGVNISSVFGTFSEAFRREVPGAEKDPRFFATGISLVAHMANPHVPAVHMNTRFIVVGEGGLESDMTGKNWFGGGMDLNPMFEDQEATRAFHEEVKRCCDRHDASYYEKFSKWCDEYFFIRHRNESRGAGGIFYDYLRSDSWEKDFAFTKDVGQTFLKLYPQIVRSRFHTRWSEEDRQRQLVKRGRYAEFNLLYDRGTRFGLMTGGNPEAILMSLPPEAKWP